MGRFSLDKLLNYAKLRCQPYWKIFFPSKGNFFNLLLALKDRGIDIHKPNKTGKSALHTAVTKEDEETVRFLIDAGADVNCKDICDNTPLHLLFDCKKQIDNERIYNIAKLLIDNGIYYEPPFENH